MTNCKRVSVCVHVYTPVNMMNHKLSESFRFLVKSMLLPLPHYRHHRCWRCWLCCYGAFIVVLIIITIVSLAEWTEEKKIPNKNEISARCDITLIFINQIHFIYECYYRFQSRSIVGRLVSPLLCWSQSLSNTVPISLQLFI